MSKKSRLPRREKTATPRPPAAGRKTHGHARQQKKQAALRKWILLPAIVALVSLLLYLFRPALPRFDAGRAFRLLERQVQFGPRVPNSPAHRACGDFLTAELKRHADHVWEQNFEYRDRKNPEIRYEGRNIIASFNLQPPGDVRILLCAHWDSRPWADRDPDPEKRRLAVPGANDGASGVAVLLEIARILKQNPPPVGVDIIFFDLEDLGDHGAAANPDSLNPFCIGSQYFADSYPDYRPSYGVLLDMVGDRDLRIPREGFSQAYAPQIVERVWRAARRAGAAAFVDEQGEAVQDDHYPFLQKGIAVIDLIDFDYSAWHTTGDTPEMCSEESLDQVGRTLVELIYGE